MDAVKTLWKALMMVRRCDSKAFALKVLYVVLGSVFPLLNLVILKLLIDTVTTVVAHQGAVDVAQLVMYIVAFCAIFLLNRLISILNGVNGDVLSQKLIDYISDNLQRQSVSLDMAYYDNPDFHDTFHRAQQEANYRPIQIVNHFMNLIGALVSIVGVSVMLVTGSWWIIIVMLVAVVPSMLVRLVKARTIYEFRRNNTQDYRRTSYYSAILTHRDFAKEVRTFGLAGYFRSRFVSMRKKLVRQLLRISRRIAWMDTLCAVVETGALALVVLLLLNKSISGAITIGSFVMLFEAFRRGQGYLSSFVGAVSGLYDSRLFIGNLFEFLELKPNIVSAPEAQDFPVEVNSVTFEDVTFRYPDMHRDVLFHYSWTARRGEINLIEGENGFGKTTMLKLLLRLYDTQQGAVKINGVDVRDIELHQLRKGIGVIFQDYVRFYCSVNENIAFGDIDNYSEERIRQVGEMVGVDSIVRNLPNGYDTPLGRMFDNGEELSMGQWQRIALARQLYSDAPVLVFDEPTAWMDIPSREKFYSILEDLKREKVVILIKHV